jgi:hypothetical protein
MEPVGTFLDICRLARNQTHRNLTVFALVGEQVFDPDYLQAFGCMQRQVGAVFAIDGKVAGLEAFGSPDTFGRFFAKPVKSYALDAIDAGSEAKEAKAAPSDQARRFLASAAKAKTESHPSVGLGETLTLESGIAAGAALVHEDRVVHLSAFRKAGRQKPGGRVGFQRCSADGGGTWHGAEAAIRPLPGRPWARGVF